MTAPNLFLVYVTDVERSTKFYSELFDITPKMVTPRYVPFEIAPGVLFALWSGRSEAASPEVPRTSELGLNVPTSEISVDEVYAQWQQKGLTVIEPPHDEPFGRSFVVADPDGNLIRVSPID
jgi:predicted enzyme related to lactoylglutathione lyase